MRTIVILVASLALAGAALAGDQQFGAWRVGATNDSGFYAGTTSEGNAILAQLCYPASRRCVWVIDTPSSCDKNSQIPAIINSSSGAAAVTLICTGSHMYIDQTQYNQKLISPARATDNTIAQAVGTIGLAFPLKSGEFQSDRYSLSGAQDAVQALMDLANASSGNSAPQSPHQSNGAGSF